MTKARRLEQKRQALLDKLKEIRSLRKGCLNEQWFPAVRHGKKTEQVRGPYFVWTHKVGKKTVSQRVRGEAAVERARQDQANYTAFREICRQYQAVAEQLGALEREHEGELEVLKKGLKSRSSEAAKSRA